ncbi:MAG: polymorphic toxin type 47 domain-containing protein [Bacteroidota bacterium]
MKNMNSVRSLRLLFLLLATTSLLQPKTTAQINDEGFNPAGEHVPSSPEAAALMKFVDVPVSHYTGVPNISIPITTVSNRSLSVPISLSYHASGNRVNEVANWVGLGWKLNAGGMITRKVRGQADDLNKPGVAMGFIEFRDNFSFHDEPDDDPASVMDWIANEDVTNANILALNCFDTQPDEFYFSIGGTDGKFAFTWEDGALPVVSSSTDVIIDSYELGPDGRSIASWKLIGPDGLVYTFGVRETTETFSELSLDDPCNGGTNSYTSGWHLSSIENPNLGIAVQFEYTGYMTEEEWDFVETLSYGNGFIPNCPYPSPYEQGKSSLSRSKVKIQGQRISMITSLDGGQVLEFVANTQRTDDAGLLSTANFTRLDEIIWREGDGNVIFKYNLDYTTAGRLLLTSVQQEGANGELVPPHELVYDPQHLPDIHSKNIDHWGYFNGASNSSLIPGHLLATPTCDVYHPGADREPNPDFGRASILEKIFYPTGGSSAFVYEGNTYGFVNNQSVENLDEFETEEFSAIKTALGDPNDPWVYQVEEQTFTITANSDMVKLEIDATTYVESEICPPACWSPQVTIEQVSGGTYSETWIIGPAPPNEIPYCVEIKEGLCLSPGEYKLTCKAMATSFETPAINYNADAVTAELKWNEVNTSVSITTKNAGGLRISEMRTSDGVNSQPITRQYRYEMDGSGGLSSGVIYGEPIYAYTGFAPADCGPLPTTCTYTQLVGSSKAIIGNTGGSHVGYRRVVENHGAGGSNGQIVYEFTSPYEAPDIINSGKPFGPPLSNGFKTGLLKTKTIKDNAGSDKRKETYEYDYNQIDINSAKISFGDAGSPSASYYCSQVYQTLPFSDKFVWWLQPLRMGHVQVKQLVEADYFNGGSVTKTTDYTYDAGLQYLKSESFRNSDSKLHQTNYFYPADANWPMEAEESAAIACMLDKHMVGMPIRTEYNVDGSLVIGNWSEYKLFVPGSPGCSGSQALPYILYSYKGGWHEEARINSYTSDGYPTEVIRRGWTPETYTWDDGLLTDKYFGDWHWKWEWYVDTHRQLKKQTDIDGQAIEYDYDGLVRLTEARARDGFVKTTQEYVYGPPKQWQGGNFVRSLVEYTDGSFDTQETIAYFDGLGRPLDSWRMGYGPLREDIVSEKLWYDEHGRLEKNVYMSDIKGGETYTQFKYEASPLNRQEKETYPDGNSVQTEYGSEGQYYKVTTTDENGNATKSTTDIIGRHKKTEDALGGITENFYDDRNNLEKVVNPENQEYLYTYDIRNRMMTKQVPGAACQNFFYEDRDLVIASNDGNLRDNNDWIVNEYDLYGRVIRTGFDRGGPVVGACQVPPTTPVFAIDQELTVNTYDTNNSIGDCSSGYEPVGKLTQVVNSVVNADGSIGGAVGTAHCFDDYGRIVATRASSLLGTDIFNHTLDMADNTRASNRSHNGGKIEVDDQFTIDHSGRLLEHTHQISAVDVPAIGPRTIGTYTYNTKDQLVGKQAHELSGEAYAYNQRGWLTMINNPAPIKLKDTTSCNIPPPTGGDGESCATCGDEEISLSNLLDLRFIFDLNIDCYIPCDCDDGCEENPEIPCPPQDTATFPGEPPAITPKNGFSGMDGHAELSYPTNLYHIRDCNEEEGIVAERDMPGVRGNYIVKNRYHVESGDEIFRVNTAQGEQFLDVPGLMALANGENEFEVLNEGEGRDCPPPCTPDPPECTAQEEAAQQASLAGLPFVTNTSQLKFPTNLYRLRLCDGTEIYLFQEEIAQLAGNYSVLQTIFIEDGGQELVIGGESNPSNMTLQGYLNIRSLEGPNNVNLYFPCDENRCSYVNQIFLAKSVGPTTSFSNYFGDPPYADLTAYGNPENSLEDDGINWELYPGWGIYAGSNLAFVSMESEWNFGVQLPPDAKFVSASVHIQLALACSSHVKLALFIDNEIVPFNGGKEYVSIWATWPECYSRTIKEIDFYPDEPLTKEELSRIRLGIAKHAHILGAEIDVAYIKASYSTLCNLCEQEPLACSEEEQQAQQASLETIIETAAITPLSQVPLPTNLYRVQLCDGSEVYLFHHELEVLQGNYLILQVIPVNGPRQTFLSNIGGTSPVPEPTSNTFFKMKLKYYNDDAEITGGDEGYKNGNIAAMYWQVENQHEMVYEFKYDELDRLEKAVFANKYKLENGDVLYAHNHAYDVRTVKYDKIGNITKIRRYGPVWDCENMGGEMANWFYPMDNLDYEYDQEKARLLTVNDLWANGIDHGFKYSTGYGYDSNGNQISDSGKTMTVQYNYLNLPRHVFKGGPAEEEKGEITLVYDSSTRLLSKTSNPMGNVPPEDQLPTGSVVYADGIEVTDGRSYAVYTPEGRVTWYISPFEPGHPSYTEPAFRYEAFCRDHLGSVRATVTDERVNGHDQVMEEFHHYPFGMRMQGKYFRELRHWPGKWNAYQYNGKEFYSDIGFDWMPYGARFYDPAVGRFTGVDPLAGEMPAWSIYSYTFNNPVRFIDPDGRAPEIPPLDVIWDFGNVLYDIGKIGYGYVTGDKEMVKSATVDLGMDAGAMMIPYVPAGVSKLRHADEAADLVKGGDDALDAGRKGGKGGSPGGSSGKGGGDSGKNFDEAREEAFGSAGMTDPDKVQFSKYDPETGTVVEFKGDGGAKIGYDGPHKSPGPHHDTQHISWQTAGKRKSGGAERGNIPYEGSRHPSRSDRKND